MMNSNRLENLKNPLSLIILLCLPLYLLSKVFVLLSPFSLLHMEFLFFFIGIWNSSSSYSSSSLILEFVILKNCSESCMTFSLPLSIYVDMTRHNMARLGYGYAYQTLAINEKSLESQQIQFLIMHAHQNESMKHAIAL